MADSRETRQQELARFLLHKARQDLDLVVSVVDSEVVADEIAIFEGKQLPPSHQGHRLDFYPRP